MAGKAFPRLPCRRSRGRTWHCSGAGSTLVTVVDILFFFNQVNSTCKFKAINTHSDDMDVVVVVVDDVRVEVTRLVMVVV